MSAIQSSSYISFLDSNIMVSKSKPAYKLYVQATTNQVFPSLADLKNTGNKNVKP